MHEFAIRDGAADDVPALTALYNHYVEETAITFDLAPFTIEQRRDWFGQFSGGGRHRILVAMDKDALLGYACSTRFRPKAAYDTTVEVSIYVDPKRKQRGVGRALYGRLFEALAGEDIHRAVAGITLPNDASVRIHERFGFRREGLFEQIGRKFDRFWDVAWYVKTMGESGA